MTTLLPPDGFHTARLGFRPIAMADSGAIFEAYAADPEVSRYLTWRPHRSEADTDGFIAHCLATPDTVAKTYVLSGRDDGALRGAFELRRSAPHRLEFGYVLARRWWGLGLITEALSAIVDWALAQDEVFRVCGICDVDNLPSARVMEKAGLSREGMSRRWIMHPNVSDEPRDCFVYARVR